MFDADTSNVFFQLISHLSDKTVSIQILKRSEASEAKRTDHRNWIIAEPSASNIIITFSYYKSHLLQHWRAWRNIAAINNCQAVPKPVQTSDYISTTR